MNKTKEVENVDAKEIEEVFASELHRSIREKLDPESKWLSADQILQILRIAGGDRRRSVHKCLLAILYRAMRESVKAKWPRRHWDGAATCSQAEGV